MLAMLARVAEVRSRAPGTLLPVDVEDIVVLNVTRATQAAAKDPPATDAREDRRAVRAPVRSRGNEPRPPVSRARRETILLRSVPNDAIGKRIQSRVRSDEIPIRRTRFR
jgi:hypothetical protein